MRGRPRAVGQDAFCPDLLIVERRLAHDSDLNGRGEVEERRSRGKLQLSSKGDSRSVYVCPNGNYADGV